MSVTLYIQISDRRWYDYCELIFKQRLCFFSWCGPGDPDLLTVKGLKAIQAAEVVVYDRLVSKDILELAHASAEMIYVGKKLDFHCVPQDQINQILVQKAQEG